MGGQYGVEQMEKAIKAAAGMGAVVEQGIELVMAKPMGWRLQLLALAMGAMDKISSMAGLDVAKMKLEALELDEADKAKLVEAAKGLDLKNDKLEGKIEEIFAMVLAASNLVGQMVELVKKFLGTVKPSQA